MARNWPAPRSPPPPSCSTSRPMRLRSFAFSSTSTSGTSPFLPTTHSSPSTMAPSICLSSTSPRPSFLPRFPARISDGPFAPTAPSSFSTPRPRSSQRTNVARIQSSPQVMLLPAGLDALRTSTALRARFLLSSVRGTVLSFSMSTHCRSLRASPGSTTKSAISPSRMISRRSLPTKKARLAWLAGHSTSTIPRARPISSAGKPGLHLCLMRLLSLPAPRALARITRSSSSSCSRAARKLENVSELVRFSWEGEGGGLSSSLSLLPCFPRCVFRNAICAMLPRQAGHKSMYPLLKCLQVVERHKHNNFCEGGTFRVPARVHGACSSVYIRNNARQRLRLTLCQWSKQRVLQILLASSDSVKRLQLQATCSRFHSSLELDAATARTWEPTLSNLAIALQKQKKHKEAIEYYEQALTLAPQQSSTYSGLAFAHQCLGQFQRAIELYHNALALNSNDAFSSDMLEIALTEELLDL
eukprot:m.151825 g.151825  ORF g.151825 m.151825 type:complete len:472 (+) comp10155_c0_seq2:6039-7454(+)